MSDELDDITPPTGPAAAQGRSAREWADAYFRQVNQREEARPLHVFIQQAMAQAHAAGREEQNAADAEAARDMAESLSGWDTPERVGERVAEAVRDALRTVSAQPINALTPIDGEMVCIDCGRNQCVCDSPMAYTCPACASRRVFYAGTSPGQLTRRRRCDECGLSWSETRAQPTATEGSE